MARKKPPKSPRTKTSFMFPLLHERILRALSDEVESAWFNKQDSNRNSTNSYETHVMGRFTCTNDRCSNSGWASKKVAIVIRGYPRNGYNAVVFNQRCKSCHQLGNLSLDEQSYVDRLVYRLKKWAGVEVPRSTPRKKDYHTRPGSAKDAGEAVVDRGLSRGTDGRVVTPPREREEYLGFSQVC